MVESNNAEERCLTDDTLKTSEIGLPSTEIVENFADNPLMDRVQLALRKQLQTTYDRVGCELREQQDALRTAKRNREDCGVELYGMQQQLARMQANLESLNKRYEEARAIRNDNEAYNSDMKKSLDDKKQRVDSIPKDVTKSKAELDVLLETVRKAQQYNSDVKAEVAITRRAAQKAEETVKELEKGKKSQDLYIDSLNGQVKALAAKVALADEQLSTQKQHTEEVNKILQETGAELDLLTSEKKHLVQQWNSSVLALNRRNQAAAAAAKSLREAQSVSKDLKSELLGLNREILQGRNEQESVKLSLKKVENECKYVETEISKLHSEQEAMANEFELLQKSISISQDAQAKLELRAGKLESEIGTVAHKIELISRERLDLEAT